jgi:hypothetical protein
MKTLALVLAAVATLTLAGTAAAIHDENQRMIGGGWIAIEDPNIFVGKVTLGFQLPCGIEDPNIHPSLEVNWQRNHFHLNTATLDACQGVGSRGGAIGQGTGTCNGEPATARFWFTNANIVIEGVPFYENAVELLEITGSASGCTLALAGTGLSGGTFRFIEDPNI